MADLTPTQLAEEFARLNAAFNQAVNVSGDMACQAANDLAAFAGLNADAIAAALTEWAGEKPWQTWDKAKIAKIRRVALEQAEQACEQQRQTGLEWVKPGSRLAYSVGCRSCREAIAALKEQS